MKRVKLYFARASNFIIRRPKSIILFSFLGLLVLTGSIESIRALYFQKLADSFVDSAAVLELQTDIERLAKRLQENPSSFFCVIRNSELTSRFNDASDADVNTPEEEIARLRTKLDSISGVPAFSSLADILPAPRHARARSEQIAKSLVSLKTMVTPTETNQYCMDLATALGNVYFIDKLSSPEGVAAMIPGQKEDFLTRASKARNRLIVLRYPARYETTHIAITKTIAQLEIDLTGNSNDYLTFARSIYRTKSGLSKELIELEELSNDMKAVPQDLLIASHQLSQK